MSSTLSLRYVYDTITGYHSDPSATELKETLQKVRFDLVNLFLKHGTFRDIEFNLPGVRISPFMQKFLKYVAKYLNVDVRTTYSITCNYIKYERYDDVESFWLSPNLHDRAALRKEIEVYYVSERMYLLKTLRALLQAYTYIDEPFCFIIVEYVDGLMTKAKVHETVVQQVTLLIEDINALRDQGGRPFVGFQVLRMLRELVELFSIIVLFIHTKIPTDDECAKYLKLLLSVDLGYLPHSGAIRDAEKVDKDHLRDIALGCFFVVLSEFCERNCFLRGRNASQIDQKLIELGNTPEAAIVRSFTQMMKLKASLSRDADMRIPDDMFPTSPFPVIKEVLKSYVYLDGHLGEVVYERVYIVIDMFCTGFDNVRDLFLVPDLVAVFGELIKSSVLAGYCFGALEQCNWLFNIAAQCFPHLYSPFCQLVMGWLESTCELEKLFHLLLSMPSYLTDKHWRRKDETALLSQTFMPFARTKQLSFLKDTVTSCFVLGDEALIKINDTYSFFVYLSEIQHRLVFLCKKNEKMDSELEERVALGYEVLLRIIMLYRYDVLHHQEIENLIGQYVNIFRYYLCIRKTRLIKLYLELICALLDRDPSMKSLLVSDDHIDDLFPKYKYPMDLENPEEALSNHKFDHTMLEKFLTEERFRDDHSIVVVFMTAVQKLIDYNPIHVHNYYNITFIVCHIFCKFQGWEYANEIQRHEIAAGCLQFFRFVLYLSKPDRYNNVHKNGKLVVEALYRTEYVIDIIFDFLYIEPHTLKLIYEQEPFWNRELIPPKLGPLVQALMLLVDMTEINPHCFSIYLTQKFLTIHNTLLIFLTNPYNDIVVQQTLVLMTKLAKRVHLPMLGLLHIEENHLGGLLLEKLSHSGVSIQLKMAILKFIDQYLLAEDVMYNIFPRLRRALFGQNGIMDISQEIHPDNELHQIIFKILLTISASQGRIRLNFNSDFWSKLFESVFTETSYEVTTYRTVLELELRELYFNRDIRETVFATVNQFFKSLYHINSWIQFLHQAVKSEDVPIMELSKTWNLFLKLVKPYLNTIPEDTKSLLLVTTVETIMDIKNSTDVSYNLLQFWCEIFAILRPGWKIQKKHHKQVFRHVLGLTYERKVCQNRCPTTVRRSVLLLFESTIQIVKAYVVFDKVLLEHILPILTYVFENEKEYIDSQIWMDELSDLNLHMNIMKSCLSIVTAFIEVLNVELINKWLKDIKILHRCFAMVTVLIRHTTSVEYTNIFLNFLIKYIDTDRAHDFINLEFPRLYDVMTVEQIDINMAPEQPSDYIQPETKQWWLVCFKYIRIYDLLIRLYPAEMSSKGAIFLREHIHLIQVIVNLPTKTMDITALNLFIQTMKFLYMVGLHEDIANPTRSYVYDMFSTLMIDATKSLACCIEAFVSYPNIVFYQFVGPKLEEASDQIVSVHQLTKLCDVIYWGSVVLNLGRNDILNGGSHLTELLINKLWVLPSTEPINFDPSLTEEFSFGKVIHMLEFLCSILKQVDRKMRNRKPPTPKPKCIGFIQRRDKLEHDPGEDYEDELPNNMILLLNADIQYTRQYISFLHYRPVPTGSEYEPKEVVALTIEDTKNGLYLELNLYTLRRTLHALITLLCVEIYCHQWRMELRFQDTTPLRRTLTQKLRFLFEFTIKELNSDWVTAQPERVPSIMPHLIDNLILNVRDLPRIWVDLFPHPPPEPQECVPGSGEITITASEIEVEAAPQEEETPPFMYQTPDDSPGSRTPDNKHSPKTGEGDTRKPDDDDDKPDPSDPRDAPGVKMAIRAQVGDPDEPIIQLDTILEETEESSSSRRSSSKRSYESRGTSTSSDLESSYTESVSGTFSTSESTDSFQSALSLRRRSSMTSMKHTPRDTGSELSVVTEESESFYECYETPSASGLHSRSSLESIPEEPEEEIAFNAEISNLLQDIIEDVYEEERQASLELARMSDDLQLEENVEEFVTTMLTEIIDNIDVESASVSEETPQSETSRVQTRELAAIFDSTTVRTTKRPTEQRKRVKSDESFPSTSRGASHRIPEHLKKFTIVKTSRKRKLVAKSPERPGRDLDRIRATPTLAEECLASPVISESSIDSTGGPETTKQIKILYALRQSRTTATETSTEKVEKAIQFPEAGDFVFSPTVSSGTSAEFMEAFGGVQSEDDDEVGVVQELQVEFPPQYEAQIIQIQHEILRLEQDRVEIRAPFGLEQFRLPEGDADPVEVIFPAVQEGPVFPPIRIIEGANLPPMEGHELPEPEEPAANRAIYERPGVLRVPTPLYVRRVPSEEYQVPGFLEGPQFEFIEYIGEPGEMGDAPVQALPGDMGDAPEIVEQRAPLRRRPGQPSREAPPPRAGAPEEAVDPPLPPPPPPPPPREMRHRFDNNFDPMLIMMMLVDLERIIAQQREMRERALAEQKHAARQEEPEPEQVAPREDPQVQDVALIRPEVALLGEPQGEQVVALIPPEHEQTAPRDDPQGEGASALGRPEPVQTVESEIPEPYRAAVHVIRELYQTVTHKEPERRHAIEELKREPIEAPEASDHEPEELESQQIETLAESEVEQAAAVEESAPLQTMVPEEFESQQIEAPAESEVEQAAAVEESAPLQTMVPEEFESQQFEAPAESEDEQAAAVEESAPLQTMVPEEFESQQIKAPAESEVEQAAAVEESASLQTMVLEKLEHEETRAPKELESVEDVDSESTIVPEESDEAATVSTALEQSEQAMAFAELQYEQAAILQVIKFEAAAAAALVDDSPKPSEQQLKRMKRKKRRSYREREKESVPSSDSDYPIQRRAPQKAKRHIRRPTEAKELSYPSTSKQKDYTEADETFTGTIPTRTRYVIDESTGAIPKRPMPKQGKKNRKDDKPRTGATSKSASDQTIGPEKKESTSSSKRPSDQSTGAISRKRTQSTDVTPGQSAGTKQKRAQEESDATSEEARAESTGAVAKKTREESKSAIQKKGRDEAKGAIPKKGREESKGAAPKRTIDESTGAVPKGQSGHSTGTIPKKAREETTGAKSKKGREESAGAISKKGRDESASTVQKKGHDELGATSKKERVDPTGATPKKRREDSADAIGKKEHDKSAGAISKKGGESASATPKKVRIDTTGATLKKGRDESAGATGKKVRDESGAALTSKKGRDGMAGAKKGPDESPGAKSKIARGESTGATPKKGHDNSSGAKSKVAPGESTGATSKKGRGESAGATAKVGHSESTGATSKKGHDESSGAKSKVAAGKSTGATAKKGRDESAGATAKAGHSESTGATSKKGHDESSGAKSKVAAGKSTGATVRKGRDESAGATAKVGHSESTGATSKKGHGESIGPASKKARGESAGATAKVGHGESTGAASKKGRDESAGATAKVGRAESTGATPKKRRDESASTSKRTREESSGAVSKRTRDEPSRTMPKKARDESTSVSSKRQPDHSTGAMPRKVPDESTGARPRRVPDESTGARPRRVPDESTGARPRRVPDETTGARPRRVPDESTGAVPRRVPDESTGAVPRRVPDESTGAIPRRVPDESTGAIPRRVSDESTGAIPRRVPDESTGAIPKQYTGKEGKKKRRRSSRSGSNREEKVSDDRSSTGTYSKKSRRKLASKSNSGTKLKISSEPVSDEKLQQFENLNEAKSVTQLKIPVAQRVLEMFRQIRNSLSSSSEESESTEESPRLPPIPAEYQFTLLIMQYVLIKIVQRWLSTMGNFKYFVNPVSISTKPEVLLTLSSPRLAQDVTEPETRMPSSRSRTSRSFSSDIPTDTPPDVEETAVPRPPRRQTKVLILAQLSESGVSSSSIRTDSNMDLEGAADAPPELPPQPPQGPPSQTETDVSTIPTDSNIEELEGATGLTLPPVPPAPDFIDDGSVIHLFGPRPRDPDEASSTEESLHSGLTAYGELTPVMRQFVIESLALSDVEEPAQPTVPILPSRQPCPRNIKDMNSRDQSNLLYGLTNMFPAMFNQQKIVFKKCVISKMSCDNMFRRLKQLNHQCINECIRRGPRVQGPAPPPPDHSPDSDEEETHTSPRTPIELQLPLNRRSVEEFIDQRDYPRILPTNDQPRRPYPKRRVPRETRRSRRRPPLPPSDIPDDEFGARSPLPRVPPPLVPPLDIPSSREVSPTDSSQSLPFEEPPIRLIRSDVTIDEPQAEPVQPEPDQAQAQAQDETPEMNFLKVTYRFLKENCDLGR